MKNTARPKISFLDLNRWKTLRHTGENLRWWKIWWTAVAFNLKFSHVDLWGKLSSLHITKPLFIICVWWRIQKLTAVKWQWCVNSWVTSKILDYEEYSTSKNLIFGLEPMKNPKAYGGKFKMMKNLMNGGGF